MQAYDYSKIRPNSSDNQTAPCPYWGFFAVSTFMIMFGIGKLTDLKYLKVVGTISLTSLLISISYVIFSAFMDDASFGYFTLLTLPLTLLVGHLAKAVIDKQTEDI